tara:strand:+ start:1904 stop:2383 length:480 start_codon:yes stop_codon:yes gene_type:complete
MNIFVVHKHPRKAARMLCDQHVVKMALESAQMLCTAINESGGQAPYKSTHKNHPCNVWARETLGNWLWLYDHGNMLCDEYTLRFKKNHKCRSVINECLKVLDGSGLITDLRKTPHPLCMPDEYKSDDVVQSYRDFYSIEKRHFATWDKSTPPFWWLEWT